MLIWKKSMMNKVINKFVITVVASLLITACTDKDNKNPIQKELERILPGYEGIGFTDDKKPIEIILRSEHKKSNGHTLKFLIPKAYLTRKANWRGGEQVDMEIQTGFPEYLPRPSVKPNRKKLGDPDYDEAEIYSQSGIYIYIGKSSLFTDFYEKPLREKNTLLAKNIISLYKKKYKSSESIHGLSRYIQLKCTGPITLSSNKPGAEKKTCVEGNHEFFLTPENYDGHWTTFSCLRLEEGKHVGCTVKTSYKRKSLTYGFRRTQLYQWQEIDAEIRRFLDSFLIEESTNDQVIYTRTQGEK